MWIIKKEIIKMIKAIENLKTAINTICPASEVTLSIKILSAEAPAPVENEAPAPVKAEEPAPVKAEEPAPVKAEEPAPVKVEEPAPVKAEEPAPVKAGAPAPVKAERANTEGSTLDEIKMMLNGIAKNIGIEKTYELIEKLTPSGTRKPEDILKENYYVIAVEFSNLNEEVTV